MKQRKKCEAQRHELCHIKVRALKTYHSFYAISKIDITYINLGKITTACAKGCGVVHFANEPHKVPLL